VISKITKGKTFRSCLGYLAKRQESQLLESNLAGESVNEMARELHDCARQNPRALKPVFHASLSTPPGETLTDDEWRSVAHDYLSGMGFDDHQFALIRHSDTDHDHVHLVANRVSVDGRCLDSDFERRRSREVVREIEQCHELTPTRQAAEQCSPTQGEYRRRERTGEASVRQRLQAAVDHVTRNQPTMPELVERLKSDGVDAQVNLTRSGKVRGISYELDGWRFNGTKLGPAYTFPGLQQRRGVRYDPAQHEELVAANRQSVAEAQAERQRAPAGDEPSAAAVPSQERINQIADETAARVVARVAGEDVAAATAPSQHPAQPQLVETGDWTTFARVSRQLEMLLDCTDQRSPLGHPCLETGSGYRFEKQGQTIRAWSPQGNEILRAEGAKPDRRIRVSSNIRREEQQKLEQVGNQIERDLTRPPPQQQQRRRGPRR